MTAPPTAVATVTSAPTPSPTWYQPALGSFAGIRAKLLSLNDGEVQIPQGTAIYFDRLEAYRDAEGNLHVDDAFRALKNIPLQPGFAVYSELVEGTNTHWWALACSADGRCGDQCRFGGGQPDGVSRAYESNDGGLTWNDKGEVPNSWSLYALVGGEPVVLAGRRGCGTNGYGKYNWFRTGAPLLSPDTRDDGWSFAAPGAGPDGTLAWYSPASEPVYADGRKITPKQTPLGPESFAVPGGGSIVAFAEKPERPGIAPTTPYLGLVDEDGAVRAIVGWTGPGSIGGLMGMLTPEQAVVVIQPDRVANPLPLGEHRIPTYAVIDFKAATLRPFEQHLVGGDGWRVGVPR